MTPLERQEILARRLAEARRRSGLSGTEVAKRIGRGRSTLQEWESGRTNPTAVDVAALANAYHCSTDWLLGRDCDTGFLATVDSRAIRVLMNSTDVLDFQALLPTVACRVHEDTVVERSSKELTKVIDELLTRGNELREAWEAAKRKK